MLNGDSTELYVDEYSLNSEPLPVDWNLTLSHIWLPKHLLPNRETPIDTNRDKPIIYHTLERPQVQDHFSVYVNSPVCVQQFSSEVLQISNPSSWKHYREIISPQKIETSNDFHSATDSERICNSNFEQILPAKLKPLHFNSIENRLESKSAEGKLLEANLEDPINEGQNYQFKNDATESVDFSTREDVIADSLEELYCSDDNDYESIFCTRAEESCKQEPTCNNNESYPNSLEQINCVDGVYNQPSEQLKEIPSESQHYKLSDLSLSSKLQEVVVNTNNHDKKCEDKVSNELAESIAKFSVAYQRPVLEESVKNKPQKEKRNKKKPKRNLLLENLFVDSEEPQNDEFYENLRRQFNVKRCEQFMNINEFPSLSQPKNASIFDIEQNESETLNLNSLTQTFNHDTEVNCANEVDSDIGLLKPKLFDSSATQIIVIENIPIGVTKDHIENIVLGYGLGYGQLKKLSIRPCGKFQRAKLETDFTCEVDWIVECLNDSQPFGIVDKEMLKCYKLQE